MIKAIRIGILAFIISLSVFTWFIIPPLSSVGSVILTIILGLLIMLCVREIGRVRKE